MKIRIELTKAEAKRITNSLKKVSKSIYSICDDEYDEEEISNDMNKYIEKYSNTKIINNMGGYESNVTDKKVIITFNIKAVIVSKLCNIMNVLYSSFAKFINASIKPIMEFIEEYF